MPRWGWRRVSRETGPDKLEFLRQTLQNTWLYFSNCGQRSSCFDFKIHASLSMRAHDWRQRSLLLPCKRKSSTSSTIAWDFALGATRHWESSSLNFCNSMHCCDDLQSPQMVNCYSTNVLLDPIHHSLVLSPSLRRSLKSRTLLHFWILQFHHPTPFLQHCKVSMSASYK